MTAKPPQRLTPKVDHKRRILKGPDACTTTGALCERVEKDLPIPSTSPLSREIEKKIRGWHWAGRFRDADREIRENGVGNPKSDKTVTS